MWGVRSDWHASASCAINYLNGLFGLANSAGQLYLPFKPDTYRYRTPADVIGIVVYVLN